MEEPKGYPKIQLPEVFGTLSEDDNKGLTKDEYILRAMKHAIITPRMRREFEQELEDGRKCGWKWRKN